MGKLLISQQIIEEIKYVLHDAVFISKEILCHLAAKNKIYYFKERIPYLLKWRGPVALKQQSHLHFAGFANRTNCYINAVSQQ